MGGNRKLQTGAVGRRHGDSTARSRIHHVLFGVGLAFAFFLGLLVRYQIIDGVEGTRYVQPASLQRRESVSVSLPRGRILDKNGVPLHYPTWGSAVAVFPALIEDLDKFAEDVSAILEINGSALKETLSRHTSPFKLCRDITPEQVEALLSSPIPGLAVIPEEVRYGPGSLARHVVGYIRPNAYLNPRDNVGESGLESWFQATLAGGTPPWAGILVTGDGQEIPGVGMRIGSSDEYPQDLLTTLDVQVQYAVERVLDEEGIARGGVVVLDARTGEILGMASRPQYDQNRPEEYFELPDSPFVNRAISDFTPGSIWKTVVLALALENGYTHPQEEFECAGVFEIGDRVIRCSAFPEGHGKITLKEALAVSCNSALIQIALRIPPERLVNWARECGFGEKLQLPLPGQSPGILPHAAGMLPGDVANFAIGQGYLTVTPLQAACFYRAVAAGGVWKSPTLIPGSDTTEKRLFSQDVAQFLQDALLSSTKEGTGAQAWVPGFGSAGKTGTAELDGDDGSNHGWFVGWVPVLSPKYVICVFCERSGDGPTVAAPLFRKIAEVLLHCR